MKKIFLLLILLLNLHIAINEGGISLESGHVFAQIQYEETLDELVVPGNAYGICEYCKSQILKSELPYHQQHQCYYREATCDICHQIYRPAEGDCLCKYNNDSNDNNNNNNENDYTICYKCGQLKKQCTCKENNSDEDDLINNISLGGGSEGSHSGGNGNTEEHQTDSVGYHKCPCLISLTTHILRSSIDNNQMLNELNDNYWELTEGLKRHIAFPETIQQGNNGTCVAATLQKYLAENYPNDYIDCVTSLAETGRYEKWNLTIPEECCLDRIDTIDLKRENQGHAEYYQNGIDYTAVDMLIQTAIQNWRNEKLRLVGLEMPNYNPVVDDGDSFSSGMTLNYAKDFLQENVYGSFGGPLSVEETIPFVTSYNQLEYLTSQYSPDSYTFIASVAVEQQNNGTYSFTTSKSANHMVEITGTKNGYINCWTWGKNGTTSTQNDYIYGLMVLKKTDAGKQLETAQQQLSCNCATCSNTGCDSCSDSLYYNW